MRRRLIVLNHCTVAAVVMAALVISGEKNESDDSSRQSREAVFCDMQIGLTWSLREQEGGKWKW